MKQTFTLWLCHCVLFICTMLFATSAIQAQQLTKTVDLATADPEEVFEYTISFTCPSTVSGDCEGVLISDVLPPEVELVNLPVGCPECSYDPVMRTFTYGPTTVDNGATISLGIQVRFPANVIDGTQAMNIAEITYMEGVGGSSQNETTPPTVTTATNGVIVILDGMPVVEKDQFGTLVEGNIVAQYRLTPGHNSANPVTQLVFEDILPSGMLLSEMRLFDRDCSSPVDYNIEFLLSDAGNPTGTYVASTNNPFNTTNSTTFEDVSPGTNNAFLGINVPSTSWISGIRITYLNVPGGADCFYLPLNAGGRIDMNGVYDESLTGVPEPEEGDVIENCATVTSTDLIPNQAEDCVSEPVIVPIHNPSYLKSDETETSPYEPGEIITFRLLYRNNVSGGFPVVNPTISDILPPEYEFLGVTTVNLLNGGMINAGSTTEQPVVTATSNFGGVPGQTRVDFTWDDATMNGITLQEFTPQGIEVFYEIRVRASAMDGAILTNTAYFYDPVENLSCPLDINDIDNDGSTTDRICNRSEDVEIIYPPGFAGLNSFKEVQGNLDTDFSRFPNSGTVSPGGNIEYNLCFENPANLTQDLDNFILVDVLPHIGDRGVVANNELRESAWQPTFTATTLANLQAYVAGISGATLYFSTVCEPCLQADLGPPISDLPSCMPPAWSTTPPSPLSDVCSFKIEYGPNFVLSPGEETCINMNMQAPLTVPTDGSIAWNSFGYVATKEDDSNLLASEPIKVGIASFASCELLEPTIVAVCDDNGTPSDPSDDTFTYTITVSGSDTGASYSISGDDTQSGLSYDVAEGPFGPFPIASGDLTITITDVDDASCQLVDETVSAPGTCSDDCLLTSAVINATCDDAGTPSDPSDDTFTYTITVSGSNTGATYSISGDDTQSGLSYDVVEGPFGPFPIASGDLTITITDVDDASCQLVDETVSAPGTCSDDCLLTSAVINATCDDAGTPSDPSDDTFTYTITVSGSNTGATYSISGDDTQSGLSYDVAEGPFGPFPIASGDLTITITDVDDASCQLVDETVSAPGTCSDDCLLTSAVINATCDDAGTPSDPSDDTFTYTITVSGSNTGATYSISGDDTQSGLSYDVAEGPFGPFPIASGDLTITVTDVDDAGCQLVDQTVSAPATCSDACVLNAPTIVATCDDNGTSDPSDDTFTYTINVNGLNTGATYSISGDDSQLGLSYNVVNGPFGPFSIASGDLTIAITDADDAGCQLINQTISAPAVCSPTCTIAPVITTACDDNGTTDPNDDTFTYTIYIADSPASGTGFSLSGDDNQAGLAYNTVHGPFGPFPISAGDLSLTVTDDDDPTCTDLADVTAPSECSDCALSGPTITAECDNQGTSDPLDDTFTFTIQVDETGGLGVNYDITGDITMSGLAYGVEHSFGPYLITDGDLTITITDEGDPACQIADATVSAPAACSPICTFDPEIVASCNDQGTSDPSDDTYSFTVFVPVGDGGAGGNGFNISGDYTANNLDYGTVHGPFGNYLITDGDISITLTDIDDPSCGSTEDITAPAECSDPCTLEPMITVTCDNQGTIDPTDDTYSYTITVLSGMGTGTNYSISGDDTQGPLAYDVVHGPFGPFLITDGDLSIDITDGDDPTCTNNDVPVEAPMECSPLPASIGDFVWEDNNANGVQDPGEMPLSNVLVTLDGTDIFGNVVNDSESTDVNGNYLFDNLVPGDYKLTFTTPTGYEPTANDQGGNDAQDSDANPAMGGMTVFETLTEGENNLTYDAGYYQPAELGNYTWIDADVDGQQDVGEQPLSGVVVVLDGTTGSGEPVNLSAITDEFGLYLFENLTPGTYKVTFESPTSEYSSTLANIGDDATDSDADPAMGGMTGNYTLESGDSDLSVDAGYWAPASIGNFVWEDLNANGQQDIGEPGIMNVQVVLTGTDIFGNMVTDITSTDVDGEYLFDDLVPGDYKLTFTAPMGYTTTDVDFGGDDTNDSDADPLMGGMTATETLTSGEDNTDYDAGYYLPAELGNYTWIDENANGTQDPGESPIGNIEVTLTGTTGSGDAVNLMQTTGADGLYLFTNLEPGTYKVTFGSAGGDYVSTITDDPDATDATDSDADTANGMTGDYVLESGDSDLSVDAGYYEPASIGDFVWVDEDGDGVQDAGEPGIEDVLVELTGTDGQGNPVSLSQMTDPNGNYLFDNLVPGEYKLTFTTPAGYTTTDVNEGGDDGEDSDADPAMGGMTSIEVLTSGEDNLDYDAGYYLPAELGNYTWLDANLDGQQDGSEDPLPGVTVVLDGTTGSGEVVNETAITDVNGLYLFDNLQPGTYKVTFQTPAGGLSSTLVNQGDDATDSDADPAMGGMTGNYTLASGDSDLSVDAGYYENASIGNFVWEDIDGDGTQDPGEPGIQGVTVELTGTDQFGNPVNETTTTDVDGSYLFDDLVPGDYKLTFTTPTGYTTTDVDQGGDDTNDSDADPAMGGMTATETLTSGENNTDYDAGYYLPAELGNYTWIDENYNGTQDPGEAPISGIEVTLTGITGSGEPVNEMQTTGADGLYLFTNLQPGTYKVTFGSAGGDYVSTITDDPDATDATDSDADGANGMTGDYTLASGDSDLSVDAGYYEPASIGDFVWEDEDGDGTQDAGEPGIENVTVELTGTDGQGNPVSETTTTGPDGSYSFDDLAPGEYKLTFTTPGGYTTADVDQGGDDTNDSDADPAMGGMTVVEVLTSGEDNTDYDAGYYQPAELGNYTWIDDNVNGQQDPGEMPLAGVVVILDGTTGSGETIQETQTTDANGLYLFTDLQPGTYKVTFETPNGTYVSTLVNQGDDATDSDADPAMGGMTGNYTLASGDSDLSVDAGFYEGASIGNFVWEDVDGDGTQDAGEPGIQGVTVELTGTDQFGNPVNETTTTDVDGSYLFDDLVPGDYKLTFTTPAGYTTTDVDQGGDDTNDSDADPAMGGMTVTETLTSGENNTDYDAGYYLPAELGNYTWIDENYNGTQDPGEAPIGGIEVTLTGTTGSGEPVNEMQTTGADGLYLFTNLQPGTYKVTFGSAGGDYVRTITDDPDATDATDSDADGANGMTGDYVLESGDSDLSVDAGYYEPASIGDFVWEDEDGDGTQDPTEPGIENVTVELTGTDGQGNPVSETTTTGPDGSYSFDDLAPGEYKLTFTTPGGYTTADVDQGGDDTNDSDADPAMGGMTVVEVLTSGEDNTDYDAGYYLPAELGDFVWLDADANGTQDAGEPGIAGVTVILDGTTGSGEPVQLTQLTGSMGEYLFTDLQPGTYKVTFQAPAGLMLTNVNDADATDATDSDADPAMGGMTGNYTLASGDSELTVDAGYFGDASIGDYVWNDLDADGIQDPNEPGIANVTVELTGTDNQGNPVNATTTTGPDGSYLFTGLAAGSYKLTFTQPADFDFASPLDAGADDEDSDANPAMGGMTVFEVLESGEFNPNYDAGFYQCPEITVFGLPLAPVCPGEEVGPLTIVTTPGAANISWSGGASIGLVDGSGAGPIIEIPAFVASAEGSPIITVTATLGQCTITSTFQIEVDDSVDPAFANCPEDIVVNNDVDKCGANVLWEDPVAFDACGSIAATVEQTEGPASGSFIGVDESPVTITYIADDGNGNDMTCSFTISVVDMQLPAINCASGIQYVPTNDSECSFLVNNAAANILDATADDNCEVVSLTHDYGPAPSNTTLAFAVFPEGNTIVTWTAVDASGNEISCTSTIRVVDEDPAIVLACPDDIEVENDPGECGAVVDFEVVFRDNCDGDLLDGTLVEGLPAGSSFPVGTTQQVFHYTDAEGNGPTVCAFTVTVNDVEDPSIVCPNNATVEIDGSVTGGPVDVMSTGPCGVTLRYFAPDFEDNCAADLELIGGQGDGPNYYAYGGFYTEEWQVTDASGNTAQCTFHITVEDPEPPVITCPVDFTVSNDEGDCGAVVNYANPIAADNCPGYTIELTEGLPSGSVFPVGTTTVEFTITDDAGNVTTCDFDVTVEDTEGPEVTCPAAVEVPTSTGDLGDCAIVIPDLTGGAVATDNCTDATNLTITQDPMAGSSYAGSHNEVVEVSITVTDEYGNSSTCIAEVIIIDDEMPTIDCSQIPTTFSADAGTCAYMVPDGSLNPIKDDNCGSSRRHDYLAAPHLNTLQGASFPVGTTDVTWIVRDAAGNTVSCTISITVTDDENPVFVNCPDDMVVNNDVDKCGANVVWSIPVAEDNCGIQSVAQTAGPAPGSYLPVGTTTITYEVTDVNGNTAECSFDIEVMDMQLPSIDCPTQFLTQSADDDCDWTVDGDLIDAGAWDNCGLASLTNDYNDGTTLDGETFPLGMTTVTWTAEDAAGNSISCNYVVIVIDDSAPTVSTCPQDIEVDNDMDECGAVVEYDTPTFEDNCDGTGLMGTLVEGLTSGSTFPVGETTVTYAYTDAAGNGPIECSFTVTVNDTQNPEITCPDNVEVGIDGTVTAGTATVVSTGPCGVTLSYEAPIGTDNCDGAITSLEGGLGSAANYYEYGGTHTETWLVTDASGNTAECSFTITVADPLPPVITCPVDFTVDNDPGDCGAVVNYAYPIDADNCPGWTTTQTEGLPSGSFFPEGNTTVSFTITDDAGNETSCSFVVTVEDTEGPVIDDCPADRDLSADANCMAAVPDLTGELIATDNCTDAANLTVSQDPVAGTLFGGAHGDEQIVTFTVTDEFGNSSTCTTILTLIDDINPTVDCSAINGDRTADAGVCSFTMPGAGFDPAFDDNCAASISHDYVLAPNTNTLAGASFPVGTTMVTWTATDENGNTATCDITITVTDDENPVFVNCPEDLTVNNDVDKCGANVVWSVPVAEDNCGIQSVVQTAGPAPGNYLPVGTTTITYEVTDVNGNTNECSFDIEVMDMQLPELSCPTQFLTQSADANCEWVVDGDLLDPGSYDNCAVTVLTNDYNNASTLDGATFPLGTTTVSWTAEDAAGNSVSCAYVVSVIDDSYPTVDDGTCPDDIEVANDTDVCGAVIDYTVPTFSDNCDGTGLSGTLVEGLATGETFPIGTTTVTYAYTDAAGNGPVECSFTVTVNDTQNPVITCPENVVVGIEGMVTEGDATIVSSGPCGVTLSYEAPVGTDNCDGAITSLEGGVGSEPNYYQYGGTYTETWMVTDASGNTAECSFTILVEDPVPPTITCPVDFTVANDAGACGAVVNYAYPIDADNCPGWTTVLTEGLPSGSFFPEGNTTVSFTITDDAGNATTCSFVVTVVDTEAPVITDCPQDREVSADDNCMAEVPELTAELVATDNCTDAASLTVSQDPVAGTLFGGAHGDQQVVTFTVTDEFGNSSTCTMVLTLVDDTNPTIDCSAINGDRVADEDLCSFTMPGAGFDPTFDDNCAATISHNYVFAPNNNTLAGATFPVGTTNVTWTATDENGNTATCDITINITDDQDPEFVNCPETMIMIGNDPDQCSGKVNWTIPVALDNCGIMSIEQTEGPLPGSAVAVCELTPITYTATDVNGNTSTCSFDVLVIDTQEPELDDDIVMPGDITVECDAVPAPFVLTNDDVNDNCTAPEDLVINFTEESTQDPDPANCGHYEYTITRTWTVTDEACALGGGANVYTHVQIIDVEDTTAPDAVCMDITVTLDKFGNVSITGADIDGGSTDNCAAPEFLTLEADPNSFDCDDLGPNNVTLTVTDPCGNASTCVAVVTVEEGIGSCEPAYDYANSTRNECLDNATTLDDGQFYELIQIHALAGQTWTVLNADGLFSTTSPAPPAAPIAIPAGTPLVNGMSDGIDNDGDNEVDEFDEMVYYYIEGIHVDCQGYQLSLINDIGQVITIENTGCYPTPEFVNLDGPFCLSTVPFDILVEDVFGAAGTVTEILVNGEPTTIFDAGALGIGTHMVQATFDAGDAANYLIVNGEVIEGTADGTLEDSGCEQTISIFVDVVGTPAQVNCNDLIQVSLEEDCISEITPDMVLEGSFFCYDDYEVIITYPFGTNTYNPPNQVDGSHAGQTLTYTLSHQISGNVCWGEILVEDKLAPVIECPEEITIYCIEDYTDVSITGSPVVTDCSDWGTEFVDDITEYSCSEDPAVLYHIVRTWIATDEFENQSECTQVITVLRPELDDIVLPLDAEFNCDEVPQDPGPEYTGWPQIGGVDLTTAGTFGCGLAVAYNDVIANTCPGEQVITRTWTITDVCPEDGSTPVSIEHVQYIQVFDVAPTITLIGNYDPVNDWYILSANGYSEDVHDACVALGPVPTAEVEDACNEVVSLTVGTPEGTTTNGGPIPEPGLLQGVHEITYTATDECGHITTLTVQVYVVDDIAPIAICDEITDVTLQSDGTALVAADVFDDGSYDNCCLDEMLVRRMDGDCVGNYDEFGPDVEFCCEDVANNPIMVVFRVVDCEGNVNDCMVEVEVEDKLPPVVVCPEDVTITCDEYLEELDASIQAGDYSLLGQFGYPSFFDNCEPVVDSTVSVNINTCAEGTIERTWEVTDPSNNAPATCTQTITVLHVSDWVVQFPEDIEASCENGELPEFGEPAIFHDECELVAVTYEDTYYYIVPDACYKISRVWTVINWCVYEDYGYDVYSEAAYAECDLFQDWDGDGDQDCRTFRDGYNESGTPGTPDGYIQYEQIIKVIDEEEPVFSIPEVDGCIVEEDCDKDLVIPYPIIEDVCSPSFEVDITGDFGPFNDIQGDITIDDVVPGTYNIYYTVTDNCGNQAYDDVTVVVEDCKKPTPYCKNGLIVELMQTGEVEVWALDLNDNSFDNCPGDLQFSFSSDVDDIGITFTCDDLGQNEVEVWVTDAAGNQDFCVTQVTIQDNMFSCNSITIAGVIATEEDQLVEGVMVEVNGGLVVQTTPATGDFNFELASGEDYSITPMLDENAGNGVTTYDLVLITQHILGINPLDSPYKLIAADANNSGSVTTLDMVVIRKVILLVEDNFPNNTSWRFVDADYSFPQPTNPWLEEFPEILNYNNLTSDDLEADFVAVKIGDVNGSVQANAQQDLQENTRTGAMILQTEERTVNAGETFTIDIKVEDVAVMGYQFTLGVDAAALQINEILPGVMMSESFGYRFLEAGILTASWNEDQARRFEAGTVLFSLELTALQAGELSRMLNLKEGYTSAEAYNAQGEELDVVLEIGKSTLTEGFALYQNTPNPFRKATTVGFRLPEATTATLTITDLTGRTLRVIQGDYDKGYHEIRITDLNYSGVLNYQLETADNKAVKRMIATH